MKKCISAVKVRFIVFVAVLLSFCLQGCDSPMEVSSAVLEGVQKENNNGSNNEKKNENKQSVKLSFKYNTKLYPYKDKAEYFPSYAVWIEDADTGKAKTLFVTRKAAGNFGEKSRPECLPVWFGVREKQKAENGKGKLDAVTSASISTPEVELTQDIPDALKNKKVNVYLEANLSFDFNENYKRGEPDGMLMTTANGQPSLLWKASFSLDGVPKDSIPVCIAGCGDVSGKSPEVFSDTSMITTAKEMFEDIKLEYLVK